MQDDEWLVVVNEALCRAAISGGLKTQTRYLEVDWVTTMPYFHLPTIYPIACLYFEFADFPSGILILILSPYVHIQIQIYGTYGNPECVIR